MCLLHVTAGVTAVTAWVAVAAPAPLAGVGAATAVVVGVVGVVGGVPAERTFATAPAIMAACVCVCVCTYLNINVCVYISISMCVCLYIIHIQYICYTSACKLDRGVEEEEVSSVFIACRCHSCLACARLECLAALPLLSVPAILSSTFLFRLAAVTCRDDVIKLSK